MTISIKNLTTDEEIAKWWEKKYEYHRKDLYPNVELGEDEGTLEEMIEWFEGVEYHDMLMNLHKTSGLKFVFFYLDDQYLGFATYIVYTKEDGKAIILEYCIDEPFRNKGLGAATYNELAKVLKSEGATYVGLDTSNSNNRRFWQRLGFKQRGLDEWGENLYVKPLD